MDETFDVGEMVVCIFVKSSDCSSELMTMLDSLGSVFKVRTSDESLVAALLARS
jgi:hypothetical protein